MRIVVAFWSVGPVGLHSLVPTFAPSLCVKSYACLRQLSLIRCAGMALRLRVHDAASKKYPDLSSAAAFERLEDAILSSGAPALSGTVRSHSLVVYPSPCVQLPS